MFFIHPLLSSAHSLLTSLPTTSLTALSAYFSSKPNTTLLSLPTETLQQIAHSLPSESAMALCRTCRTLLTVLHFEDSASVLRHDREARCRFQDLVMRDMRLTAILLCEACGEINRFVPDGDEWWQVQCRHWTMRQKGLPESSWNWWLRGRGNRHGWHSELLK